jgi:DNA repair protein RadC
MSEETIDSSDDGSYLESRSARLGPHERLRRLGVRSLSRTDLLGLVIGSPDVAESLVRSRGLTSLAELTPSAWQRERGIGKANAVRLSAVFELGRRMYCTQEEAARPRLTRPRDVFKQVRHIGALRKEHLVGLYLDAQNGLTHMETVSVGSLNTTRTHPREILYPAIVHLAFGFILAHNHPSGSLDPSDEDIAFSRSVQRAGEVVGIELYDHLIVTATGFTSLRERGAL